MNDDVNKLFERIEALEADREEDRQNAVTLKGVSVHQQIMQRFIEHHKDVLEMHELLIEALQVYQKRSVKLEMANQALQKENAVLRDRNQLSSDGD